MYSHSAQQGKGNSWCFGALTWANGWDSGGLSRWDAKCRTFMKRNSTNQNQPFRVLPMHPIIQFNFWWCQWCHMAGKNRFSSTSLGRFIATSGCQMVFSGAPSGSPSLIPSPLQFPRFGNRTPIFRTAPRCGWRFSICCCPYSCSAGMSSAFTGLGLAARPAFRCWYVRKKGRQSLMPSWHLPSWTLHSLCLGEEYIKESWESFVFFLTLVSFLSFMSWLKSASILGVQLWFGLQPSRNLSPQPTKHNFNQFQFFWSLSYPILTNFPESYTILHQRSDHPLGSSTEINLPGFSCSYHPPKSAIWESKNSSISTQFPRPSLSIPIFIFLKQMKSYRQYRQSNKKTNKLRRSPIAPENNLKEISTKCPRSSCSSLFACFFPKISQT